MVRNAAFPLYLPDRKESSCRLWTTSTVTASRSPARMAPVGELTEMNKLEYRLPQICPDRVRIAYSDDGSVYMVDVSTGETSKVGRWRIAPFCGSITTRSW